MNNNAKLWHSLQSGDLIDIVAPSAGIEPHQINRIAAFVKAFGFTPRISKDICGTTPYYAHDDSYRLEHLTHALYSQDSKAVWCLRGGYGSSRLIPQLLSLTPPKHCKLFIGFSDITALHLLLNQHWHWPTLHGSVLFQAIEDSIDELSLDTLKQIMLGTQKEIHYPSLIPLNQAAKQQFTLASTIIGGNLALLEASLGTSWQLNSKNRILFIEEVSERGYRIDRMLTHLSQTSALDGVQAIIFGDIVGGEEKNGDNFTKHAIESFASSLDIPMVQAKMLGHGKRNIPLPLGYEATLKLGPISSLTCKTGAH